MNAISGGADLMLTNAMGGECLSNEYRYDICSEK